MQKIIINSMKLTVDQALQKAVLAHREGKIQEAERLYRSILQIQLNHPDTNHNLGVITASLNKFDDALPLFKTAVKANPRIEQFWLSYIDALIKYKQFDNANSILEEAKKKGFFGDKFDALNQRIILEKNELSPSNLQLKDLLDHYKNKRYEHAEKLAISITREFPNHQFSWKILGAVFNQTGRISDGVTANQKAVRIDPKDAEAYNNLAVGLQEINNFKDAETSYRKAIFLNPDYAEAHSNLGNILEKIGQLEEAEVMHRKAIILNPDYADAHNNLGVTLKELGLFEQAEASYTKAISLNRKYSRAYTNRNFCLNYSSAWSPLFIYQRHLEFEKQFGKLEVRTALNLVDNKLRSNKLRIGYVSADFRDHSVAYFFEPLLQHHNDKAVEIFCYYNNKKIDDTTNRLIVASHHWRSIFDVSDADVINIIKNDKIDILVDLSGHTGKNRLLVFAQKPAPIQVTWLGYPNTTGLSAIDYRFTDIIADPIGEADNLHSETLLRLPNGFQCYKGSKTVFVDINLPQKRQGYITFGSFNNLLKVTPEVINVWSRILHKIPTSRLLLKSSQLNNKASHYLKLFNKEGISKDRIKLYGMLPNKNEHLELYNSIDIGLDPFPFNGATTTCEALWMGVPVITLLGDSHAGRVGASILTNVGLRDFIAQDIHSYIALAIEMADNTNYIQKIRRGLRKKMQKSPLCDASSFAKDIEKTYQDIWHKYLN